jgi:hypothetical protein
MATNIYGAIALTGGAAGALDAIDGTGLADKDTAIVFAQAGRIYHYILDADSAAAESSPGVIAPDANGGDKRWILHDVSGNVPIGGIILWSGTVASIPANWHLCDGTESTPDLRDKFIVGAKQDDAGVAKTNLTGSLTASGGSVSHQHAAHDITQPAINAHSITQPSAHNITQPAIDNHDITQPAINAHDITQPAFSNHSITQPGFANHTYTTAAARTSSAAGVAAVTAVSAHSRNADVALSAHSISTSVTLSAHSLSTTVAVSAHSVGTPVALSAHADTAISAHSLSATVALSAHDTLSAPMPYYALAYIMRIT